MAFECGPCEIDLTSTLKDSFTTNYREINNETTKIEITVKNVKTYYSNKLFKQISFIKDIMTDTDATSPTAADFRLRWMQSMFMKPSEYKADYDLARHHIVGDSQDRIKINTNPVMPILPDDTWHFANVRDEFYVINTWHDLSQSLQSIFTSNIKLIRDSRFADSFDTVNDLFRPYLDLHKNNMWMDDSMIFNIESSRREIKHHIRHLIKQMLDHYGLDDNGESYLYYYIKNPVDLYYTEPNPTMNYYEFYDPERPEQVLVEPEFNDEKNCSPMVEPEFNDEKFCGPMVEPEFNDAKRPFSAEKQEFYVYEKECGPMVEPEFNLSKEHHEMVEPEFNDEKFCGPMVEPEFNLYKPEQNLVEPEFNLTKEQHNMVEPEFNDDKFCGPMVEPEFNLDKTD